jgi:cell division initiation protein
MEVALVPLTPLDIHNKEFNRGFRGYDEDEVNEFLDQIIKDYEQVIREKKEIEERVHELTEKLGHFTNIEETLNKSILIAQETAEDVKRNAQSSSLKKQRKMRIALLMSLLLNLAKLCLILKS